MTFKCKRLAVQKERKKTSNYSMNNIQFSRFDEAFGK